MELAGLEKALTNLTENKKMRVESLTTDRHASVKKYMRTQHKKIKHWFDVWHIEKGLYIFLTFVLTFRMLS